MKKRKIFTGYVIINLSGDATQKKEYDFNRCVRKIKKKGTKKKNMSTREADIS